MPTATASMGSLHPLLELAPTSATWTCAAYHPRAISFKKSEGFAEKPSRLHREATGEAGPPCWWQKPSAVLTYPSISSPTCSQIFLFSSPRLPHTCSSLLYRLAWLVPYWDIIFFISPPNSLCPLSPRYSTEHCSESLLCKCIPRHRAPGRPFPGILT